MTCEMRPSFMMLSAIFVRSLCYLLCSKVSYVLWRSFSVSSVSSSSGRVVNMMIQCNFSMVYMSNKYCGKMQMPKIAFSRRPTVPSILFFLSYGISIWKFIQACTFSCLDKILTFHKTKRCHLYHWQGHIYAQPNGSIIRWHSTNYPNYFSEDYYVVIVQSNTFCSHYHRNKTKTKQIPTLQAMEQLHPAAAHILCNKRNCRCQKPALATNALPPVFISSQAQPKKEFWCYRKIELLFQQRRQYKSFKVTKRSCFTVFRTLQLSQPVKTHCFCLLFDC